MRTHPRLLGLALSAFAGVAAIVLTAAGCAPPLVVGAAAPVATSAVPAPTSPPAPVIGQPRPRLTKARALAPAPRPTTKTPVSRPTTTQAPPSGIDVWMLASGHAGPVGPGTKGLIQYRVEVEQATNVSASSVASTVHSTLAGARGWTNEGWAFERVTLPTSEVDMVVRLATPKTVDKYCYPLQTAGVVSCRIGKLVMLNLTRWNTGVPAYSGQVGQYRILLVNHEVGHRLGHAGHPPCPGPDLPQPVMMQVYYTGLQGCVRNVWPYAGDGSYIG